MSNEYKDWLADNKSESNWWMKEYPFLNTNNNPICPWNQNGCWFDDIPAGWVMSFGKQLCDDLVVVLGEYVNDFHIIQMKEKYSHLVVYWELGEFNSYYDEAKDVYNNVDKIFKKYYELSYKTCWICGKTATKFTVSGLIAAYCDECFEGM